MECSTTGTSRVILVKKDIIAVNMFIMKIQNYTRAKIHDFYNKTDYIMILIASRSYDLFDMSVT